MIVNTRPFAPKILHFYWRKQFLKFALVSLIGLLLNNLIVYSLETPLGALLSQPAYGYLPAKIIATGIVVFWNHFTNRN